MIIKYFKLYFLWIIIYIYGVMCLDFVFSYIVKKLPLGVAFFA